MGAVRTFRLSPGTMDWISQISGKSQYELELEYMNARDKGEVVIYTMQVTSDRRSL